MERKNDEEILTYGFYLRFAQKSYIPCPKCQKRLHEKLMKYKWSLQNNENIKLIYQPTLNNKSSVSFEFLFLSAIQPTIVGLIPCDNCQPYLLKIIRKSGLILGNRDYTDPPVELWRKWLPKNTHS